MNFFEWIAPHFDQERGDFDLRIEPAKRHG